MERCSMNKKHLLLLAFGILGVTFLLSGCTEKVDVQIVDGYVETVVNVPMDMTVEEVLEEAEIALNEGDAISTELILPVTYSSGTIVIKRKATVTLADGESEKEVVLNGGKVKDALAAAGITIDDNDLLNYEQEVYLEDGMCIQVVHRQEVCLEENGNETIVYTTAKTVDEFLSLESIRLGEKDRIFPKPAKAIEEGMRIRLKRVDVKKQVEIEAIPYETETKLSDSMEEGTSEVTRKGINGKKKVTYEITFVDGKEESRKAVKEKIVKEPVSQVVTKGAKKKDSGERTIVSKEKVLDCDGSGHGYYIITYSDGTVEYEEF